MILTHIPIDYLYVFKIPNLTNSDTYRRSYNLVKVFRSPNQMDFYIMHTMGCFSVRPHELEFNKSLGLKSIFFD